MHCISDLKIERLFLYPDFWSGSQMEYRLSIVCIVKGTRLTESFRL